MYCASCVSLERQEERHGSTRADLLTIIYDQVHKPALLKQTCLTACCGLQLLRRVMTLTCHSCTKLQIAARSSFQHADIRRIRAVSTPEGGLNTSMHNPQLGRACSSISTLGRLCSAVWCVPLWDLSPSATHICFLA